MIVISPIIECVRENLWKREIRTSVEKLHRVIKFEPRFKVLIEAVILSEAIKEMKRSKPRATYQR